MRGISDSFVGKDANSFGRCSIGRFLILRSLTLRRLGSWCLVMATLAAETIVTILTVSLHHWQMLPCRAIHLAGSGLPIV